MSINNRETIIGDIKDVVDKVATLSRNSNIVVIHGCNCLNNMGAGLAKRIKQLYPSAEVADNLTKAYDSDKLGGYSLGVVSESMVVVNLYSQFKYGGSKPNVDYEALREGLELVVERLDSKSVIFLIPAKIGCGLAGGDINIVKPMIEDVFGNSNYYLFDI